MKKEGINVYLLNTETLFEHSYEGTKGKSSVEVSLVSDLVGVATPMTGFLVKIF